MVLERDIEEDVVDYAKRRRVFLILKLNVLGQVGWPDRLFIHKGQILFIEFKRPDEGLRKIQAYRANKIREHGFRVEVVDDRSDGYRIIRELTPDYQIV